MIRKVNGKDLHLTTFEVETSSKNVRLALVNQKELAKFQLAIEKASDDDPESQVHVLDQQIEMMDSQVKFLTKILKLSDKQVDKLWDAPFMDLFNFAAKVTNVLMGVDQSKSEE